MAPYEAFYGRECQSLVCWDDVGEQKLSGPEMVQIVKEKVKLIMKRLKTAQSRQKSFEGKHCSGLGFEVGDSVFLRVSPMKDVVRFGNCGKLNPRYIWPFKVVRRVGAVTYHLALPPDLA